MDVSPGGTRRGGTRQILFEFGIVRRQDRPAKAESSGDGDTPPLFP